MSIGAAHRQVIDSPDGLIAYLAQLVRGLDQSAATTCISAIGPFHVRLTLHGTADRTAIFDAMPAARLAMKGEGAPGIDFMIDVIDGARCNVARPRLAWCTSDFGFKRLVPGWSDSAVTTYFLRSQDGVAVSDWRSNRAYVWVPSIATIVAYEQAAPLRWLIEGFAQRRGLLTMHAAAIGERGSGLMIVGQSGCGKSTLALAAVEAGMDYLADDYCLVDPQSPCTAYRLFNTAKLRPDSGVQPAWTVQLEHQIEPMSGGKRIVNLARHAPHALVDRLEIRALLLPEITGEPQVRIKKASAKEAFCQAAPSTVGQCEGSEQQTVAAIGRLSRMLPAYRIRIASDPRRSIECIRKLVRELPPLQGTAS